MFFLHKSFQIFHTHNKNFLITIKKKLTKKNQQNKQKFDEYTGINEHTGKCNNSYRGTQNYQVPIRLHKNSNLIIKKIIKLISKVY